VEVLAREDQPVSIPAAGAARLGQSGWSKSSLNAITATNQIEQFDPVVHLLNGDLSYCQREPGHHAGGVGGLHEHHHALIHAPAVDARPG
jgi:hypothetical protein